MGLLLVLFEVFLNKISIKQGQPFASSDLRTSLVDMEDARQLGTHLELARGCCQDGSSDKLHHCLVDRSSLALEIDK